MSSPNMNDVVDILEAFKPSRKYRRQMAGAQCTMCGLGIVAVDFGLVEVESLIWPNRPETRVTTRPIHQQCTALLWDMVYELREEADATDEAGIQDQTEIHRWEGEGGGLSGSH